MQEVRGSEGFYLPAWGWVRSSTPPYIPDFLMEIGVRGSLVTLWLSSESPMPSQRHHLQEGIWAGKFPPFLLQSSMALRDSVHMLLLCACCIQNWGRGGKGR